MIWLIQPFYVIPYSLRAFVIVTAAGLGNLPGVIAPGFGIAVVEQFGALLDEIADINLDVAADRFVLRSLSEIRCVQKRRTFDTDIDERCLHSGQYSRHFALIDVTDQSSSARAFDQHLLKHAIL